MAPSFTLWVTIYNGVSLLNIFVLLVFTNFFRLIYITASRYGAVRITFLNTLYLLANLIGFIKRNLATLMWPTSLRIQITRFIS